MLQISDDAVDVLRQLGRLRIRGVESEGEIELEIEEAEEPVADDLVVERNGVEVYLDPVASNALEDQVLGIHSHGDHFHFSFDTAESDSAYPNPGRRASRGDGETRERRSACGESGSIQVPQADAAELERR